MKVDKRPLDGVRLGAITAVAALALGACSTTPATGGPTPGLQPPTAGVKLLTSVGTGEGSLNLVTTEGYTDSSWAVPFTTATGCKITPKYVGSFDEIVKTMKDGGGGEWDMVSAAGDAALALIYSGAVNPMNTTLIPDFTYIPTVPGASNAQTAVLVLMHVVAAAVIVRLLTSTPGRQAR